MVGRESKRVHAFNAAIQALRSQILQWSGYEQYVMADTSFYIHHTDKLENIDPGVLLGDPHADFVVLVPMVIVDKLDRLKESKDSRPGGVRATCWRCWTAV